MSDLLGLTRADTDALADLFSEDTELTVVIPDTIDPAMLHMNLLTACRAVGAMRRATGKLYPIIGRLLILARDHPEVWQERGHKSYDAYLKTEIVPTMGISRPQLLAMRRTYERWPSLPLSTYEKLGSERLKILAAVGQQSDPSSADLIDRALNSSAIKLREWAERERHVAEGSLEGGMISFPTTKELETRWHEFWTDMRVQSVAGETQGAIFEALIDEAFTEWIVKAEDREERKREVIAKYPRFANGVAEG